MKLAKRVAAPEPISPPKMVLPPLPDDYHKDKIVAMPVTPKQIYVYWDFSADKMAKYKGSLNLRIMDIKGNCFFYTPVSGRTGESFVNINPGSEYAVEIGVIDYKGEFVNILQPESDAASEFHAGKQGYCKEMSFVQPTEVAGRTQGKALPEEFFEMPEPVSSF